LAPYSVALGINFVISSWTTVHTALLMRNFRFRAIAVIEVVAAALGTVVAAMWGVATHSGWAILAGTIASSFFTAIGTAAAARWRPRWQFQKAAARELLNFSLGVTGFQFVNFFMRNVDNLVVGRFLGPTALGYYSRGYQVLLYPLRQIAGVVGRVMFPALSAIQHDRERTKAAYLRSTGAIALIAFPTMAGLIVVAHDFVLVLLGPRWVAAVPAIRLFAVVGLLESLSTTVGWIYLAQGKTTLQFIVGVAAGVPIVIGIGLGVAGGSATTVALGYAAATAIWWYPAVAIPGRLIDLSVTELARAVSGVVACTAAMALSAVATLACLGSAAPVVRLFACALVGAGVYAGLVHTRRLRPYVEMRAALTRQG
jgi:PST family polysaccharide transporter